MTIFGVALINQIIINKILLAALESRDPVFYNALLSGVNDDQRKTLQDIYVLADQRLAAAGEIYNFLFNYKVRLFIPNL